MLESRSKNLRHMWMDFVGVGGRYYLALFPFLPGLGVRKGRELQRVVEHHVVSLHNREDLRRVAELGDVVFSNCNGFLSTVA